MFWSKIFFRGFFFHIYNISTSLFIPFDPWPFEGEEKKRDTHGRTMESLEIGLAWD